MSIGQVVIVTNKNSPHYGKRAVIQYESLSGKSYYLRALKKRPTTDRFLFNQQGRVRATRPPEERFQVRKSSVRKTAARAPPNINTWQPETGRLLDENRGLTRAQIRKKYHR